MLTESATYDELFNAMKEAREYGFSSINNPKVRRAFRLGATEVFHRVRTPQSKHCVLYQFNSSHGKGKVFRTFLVLQGREGDSFAGGIQNGEIIEIIHSHAIRRYIERRRFKGSLEKAQHKIVKELLIHYMEADGTTPTDYIYFDGGVFLCTRDEHIIHLRTFIMNRQCSPVQRIKSLQSEKKTKELINQIISEHENEITHGYAGDEIPM